MILDIYHITAVDSSLIHKHIYKSTVIDDRLKKSTG